MLAVAKPSKLLLLRHICTFHFSKLLRSQLGLNKKWCSKRSLNWRKYIMSVSLHSAFLLIIFKKKRRNLRTKFLLPRVDRIGFHSGKRCKLPACAREYWLGSMADLVHQSCLCLTSWTAELYSSVEIQLDSCIYFSLLKKSVRQPLLPDEYNNNVFWKATKNRTSLNLVLCAIYSYSI